MNNEPISVLVKRASNAVRRQLDEQCFQQVSGEISGMSGLILKYLDDHDGSDVFLTDLEREFTIRKSSLTEMLHSLESKGYIVKSSFGGDARYKKITITAAGREMNARFKQVAVQFEGQLLSVLTEQEAAALQSGLKKIIQLFE